MTQTKTAHIDLTKVTNVYKGRAGLCCCGCSGKHTYTNRDREKLGKLRGYPIQDDEINDKKVASIVKKMNKLLSEGISPQYELEDFISIVDDKTVYIAYTR
jgi:hypothetical protein